MNAHKKFIKQIKQVGTLLGISYMSRNKYTVQLK